MNINIDKIKDTLTSPAAKAVVAGAAVALAQQYLRTGVVFEFTSTRYPASARKQQKWIDAANEQLKMRTDYARWLQSQEADQLRYTDPAEFERKNYEWKAWINTTTRLNDSFKIQ